MKAVLYVHKQKEWEQLRDQFSDMSTSFRSLSPSSLNVRGIVAVIIEAPFCCSGFNRKRYQPFLSAPPPLPFLRDP